MDSASEPSSAPKHWFGDDTVLELSDLFMAGNLGGCSRYETRQAHGGCDALGKRYLEASFQ